MQARLDGQFRDSDALDVKALGLLGADAAALAVLVATHDALSRLWWIPAVGLGIAGMLLLAAVWPRTMDSGPDWRRFYDRWGGAIPAQAARQMLVELLAAVETNDAQARKAHGKNVVFKLAFALLVVSLVGSGIEGYVR